MLERNGYWDLSILFLNPISSILNKKFNDLENNFFGHTQIPQFSLGTQGLWLLKKMMIQLL